MPIEFACSSCSKLLRVADDSAGKVCKCPACGSRELIPELDIIEIVEASEEDLQEDSSKLRIPCPNCSHELICDRSLIGTKGQCRSCKCIFVISQDPKRAVPIDVASALVFNCPKCNQLFEGKEEMRGRKGKCHVCNEVFTIQLKEAEEPVIEIQPAVSPKPPSQKKAPASTTKKPAPLSPIRFQCVQCGGTMEVPGSTAGQKTACPYCQTVVTIPNASAPQRPTSPKPAPAVPKPTPQPAASQADFWSTVNAPAAQAPSASFSQGSYGDHNPYASTQSTYAPPSYGSSSYGPQRRAPELYIIPGTILAIASSIGLAYLLVVTTLVILTMVAGRNELEPGVMVRLIGNLVGVLVSGGLLTAALLGSISMIRRRGLRQARIAAVLSVIPCSCLFFTLPIGIWACVLVFSEQAKRDFTG